MGRASLDQPVAFGDIYVTPEKPRKKREKREAEKESDLS